MKVNKKRPTTPRPTRRKSKQRATPGFDLAQLAWEPSTDDEREWQRRREPWFTFWTQLTDDEAIATLNQILALRKTRLRSANAGKGEHQEALFLGAKLIEGAIGWAVAERMGLSFVWAEHLKRGGG